MDLYIVSVNAEISPHKNVVNSNLMCGYLVKTCFPNAVASQEKGNIKQSKSSGDANDPLIGCLMWSSSQSVIDCGWTDVCDFLTPKPAKREEKQRLNNHKALVMLMTL
jgi:hypothetical protein